MFARKFSSDGRMRWPTPWRARNATRSPASVPTTNGADGSPNGVETRHLLPIGQAGHVVQGPLPPITPMRTAASAILLLLLQLDEHAVGARRMHESHERVLGARTGASRR